jgi:hypothetical protein
MTRLTRSISLLCLAAALGGIACAGAGAAEKNCRDIAKLTFEGWQNWRQVTAKPVQSAGHSNNWVGIYVDALALKTYLSAGAPYPPCARIVKPIYEDSSGATVRKLTVMVKMPPGYDPENGDWWYANTDPVGTQIYLQGRLQGCIPCHKQAAETDYLFSKEVLEATKE